MREPRLMDDCIAANTSWSFAFQTQTGGTAGLYSPRFLRGKTRSSTTEAAQITGENKILCKITNKTKLFSNFYCTFTRLIQHLLRDKDAQIRFTVTGLCFTWLLVRAEQSQMDDGRIHSMGATATSSLGQTNRVHSPTESCKPNARLQTGFKQQNRAQTQRNDTVSNSNNNTWKQEVADEDRNVWKSSPQNGDS